MGMRLFDPYQLFFTSLIRVDVTGLAKPDSPYTLAYPGSLVDFLQQVDSVKKFGKTSVELNTVLKSINDRELRDDPEIEQRLRAENEHCKMAGAIGLDRSNFKTSYSAELCPDFH
ncbi:hypothetical protein ANCDUO_26660, partial [Ancylostoma duodenale]